jgi:signal transduction histidine kinase/ligand-binding sensor domain-containing protein
VPDALFRLSRAGFRLLLSFAPGFACVVVASESSWFYRPWTFEDHLPNNTVTAVVQTRDGFLWLGTPSGLVRFDGVNFEDFSPTNFIAPPNRGIMAMLLGHQGELWLALDRGAVVCLPGHAPRAFISGLPTLIPNGLAEDAEGNLYIAYAGGSVCRIKDGSTKIFGEADDFPGGNDVCALAADKRGRVWFAKAGRLGWIRDGKFEALHQLEPSRVRQSNRLAASRNGGLWLCRGFALFKIDETGKVEDFGSFHPERAGTAATTMIEDHEGAVWIGTSFSGLFRHDDSGFQAIETSHPEIAALTEDAEGNIWVGTGGGGLNRISRRAISLEGTDAGLPFAAVQSICEDSNGTIWAATQNGVLARRTGDKWTALSSTDAWPQDVTSVAADQQGGVWIGTSARQTGAGARLHEALYRWRKGEFMKWGDPAQIRGQTIHTLLVSKSGDLWIGEETPHSVQRLRSGQLRTFDIPQDSRVIRAMAEDATGNVWAATSKGLLFRISGDEIAEVSPRPDKELASIRCLYATPDGSLWIGYAGWGLGRLKNGKYTEIHTEHGLHDDYVSHIISDAHGWLWMAANRGIFKVSEEELDNFTSGRARQVRSIHYGRGEGLPSLQGNFGDAPDVLRSRDGRLWIPMRTALAVVDAVHEHEVSPPPPVLVRRILVDDNPVAWYSGVLPELQSGHGPIADLGAAEAGLRLPPGHRRLDFEFSALSFTAPENIQFRYRLENYDDNWRETALRVANYSRLPAGNYVFRVLARTTEGEWTKTGAVLSVAVDPFFWQTWWFKGSVLTSFTLCVIAAVRYVSFRRLHQRLALLEQQAALHKERARIAKDIHDDLGANLTQIALLGELAQQDRGEPEKAGERMTRISGTARNAIKSLDEIVWAVNPRNDTLAHLIDYAGQFALDYLRVAGIRCRLDFPEQAPPHELSTDLRHNLFLVIKEALNNIVKHSHASEAWLRAHITPEQLTVVIEDNGAGFEGAPNDAQADGLRNMRQRMADIGGECRIESHVQQGTSVILHLPWTSPNGVAP